MEHKFERPFSRNDVKFPLTKITEEIHSQKMFDFTGSVIGYHIRGRTITLEYGETKEKVND